MVSVAWGGPVGLVGSAVSVAWGGLAGSALGRFPMIFCDGLDLI